VSPVRQPIAKPASPSRPIAASARNDIEFHFLYRVVGEATRIRVGAPGLHRTGAIRCAGQHAMRSRRAEADLGFPAPPGVLSFPLGETRRLPGAAVVR